MISTPPVTTIHAKRSEMVTIPHHKTDLRQVTKKEYVDGTWWGRVRFKNRSLRVVYRTKLDLWEVPTTITVGNRTFTDSYERLK